MNKQNYQIVSKSPTSLTEKDLIHIQHIVVDYLKDQEFITNRILRKVTSVTYDQAIFFHNEMLKKKVLQRIGKASAIRYILNTKKPGVLRKLREKE